MLGTPRLKPWGTQKQKQIPFGDDNKKSRGKATARLGWEVVWIEKQISPLRAARSGRNDLRKEVLILLILRSRVDFDGHKNGLHYESSGYGFGSCVGCSCL